MKNSFKILLGLFLVIFAVSCSKDDGTTTVVAEKQDVVFDITNVVPQVSGKNAMLSGKEEAVPICTDLVPSYAKIKIDGVEYTTDVYRLDGKLYTQSIKLDVGTYSVSDFLLYSADNTLIMATPETGSAYASYVSKPVAFDITVNAFEKAEIPIEVLCFVPQNYTYFGFTWFASTEIAVRKVCFFGDICLNGEPFAPADFNGSLYGSNVGVDVSAIMKIIVKRNGQEVPNSPFKNLDALNSPLCVQYPDLLNVTGEVFTFELQLWLPDANGFSYQTYAIYTATDGGALNVLPGADGVLDFVVGTCGNGGADQTFDFIYTPPVPPVVTAGYVPGGTKKGNARWRNLRLDGNGWELAVGQNIPTTNWTNIDFNYDYDYYFSSETTTPNLVTYTYNAVTGDQTIEAVVNGGTVTKTQNNGNLGTINYMQWQVNGDPGKTLEFNNVQLTVGGQTYNLGSFETEYGDWYINYDLTSGFSLTGEMVINGQATGDEGMKLEISAKEF